MQETGMGFLPHLLGLRLLLHLPEAAQRRKVGDHPVPKRHDAMLILHKYAQHSLTFSRKNCHF